MAELSFAEVDALLKYEPETGKLFWKERTPDMFAGGKYSSERSCSMWNAKNAGKEAFTTLYLGYRQGAIYARGYQAHRVAWLLATGNWPSAEIDHINGIRSDNRLQNLRDVQPHENQMNRPIPSQNTSGCMGVYWDKRWDKWYAKIGLKGRSIHLGRFDSFEDAVLARKEAESTYGFHPNHGRRRA